MKLVKEAGWRTPPNHPDLDPANESKILAEYLRAVSNDQTIKSKPAEFRQLLSEAEEAAWKLVESSSTDKGSKDAAATYFDQFKNS